MKAPPAIEAPTPSPARALDWFRQLGQQRLALVRRGARALLDGAEWQAERVLHLGRLVIWLGLFALVAFVWRAPVGSLLAAGASLIVTTVTGADVGWRVDPHSALDWALFAAAFVGGAALWAAYWWVLHHRPAWRWLRFAVIVVDVLSLVRFAVGIRGVEVVGAAAGGGLTAEALARVLPAMFVVVALSGVLRLHPATAIAAAVGALGGQLAVGALLGQPPRAIAPELTILALTSWLGVQFVFVLRGVALKAAEQEVLERFVPQGLTQQIARAGGHVPARVTPVTILIADLRGFTTLAEPLGPHRAVALLNDFFATIVGPLAAEEAVLDKYLGDGLLAFVEGPDHAARGLRAACGMVAAVQALNARRAAAPAGASGPPLHFGVAVHTAPAFVGTIGAPVRTEYTIIGDAVNVTARLEGLMSSKAGAERLDAVLVASRDTTAAAAAAGVVVPALRGPVQVAVHGRASPLDIYYLPPGA